ncbi:MAG: DUF3298 domain-containing protein [Chitinophagaceae bacterium]
MKKQITPVFTAIALCCSVLGFSQTNGWYKQFTGKTGSAPVSLHLQLSGSNYSGYYYSDKDQLPVYLTGTSAGEKNGVRTISLGGIYPPSPDQEQALDLRIGNNAITGTWKKSKGAPGLVVSLTQVTDAASSFVIVRSDSTVKLRRSLQESPEAVFDISSVWPGDDNPNKEFLCTLIRQQFDSVNTNKDLSVLFTGSRNAFIKNYLDDYRNTPDSEIVQSGFAYGLTETSTLQIMYQSDRLLSLAHFVYSYTGGAHGNYGTLYVVADLKNKKTVKLSDVLTPAGICKLDKLLEDQFRKDRKLGARASLTGAGLFENFIKHNENFYLTGTGIGFGFTPYEIAAYAFGEINIFLPFSSITMYLQPGYKH